MAAGRRALPAPVQERSAPSGESAFLQQGNGSRESVNGIDTPSWQRFNSIHSASDAGASAEEGVRVGAGA